MKNRFLSKWGIFFTLATLTVACNLEKEVDLNLPEFQPQIVAEVYLEPGKPYRAIVLESTSYFEAIGTNLPVVADATVFITYNGVNDTLQAGIFFAGDKIYNYGSPTIVPTDYDSDFQLTIVTADGKRLTSTTRIMPPVALDSARYEMVDDSLGFLLTFSSDDASTVNFYRRTLHRTHLLPDSLKIDFAFEDTFTDANNRVVLGGPPVWIRGDTVILSLYNISEDFYKYLDSRERSERSNGNPFGQPGAIYSNLEGGIGIFTGFVPRRDTLIIPQ